MLFDAQIWGAGLLKETPRPNCCLNYRHGRARLKRTMLICTKTSLQRRGHFGSDWRFADSLKRWEYCKNNLDDSFIHLRLSYKQKESVLRSIWKWDTILYFRRWREGGYRQKGQRIQFRPFFFNKKCKAAHIACNAQKKFLSSGRSSLTH